MFKNQQAGKTVAIMQPYLLPYIGYFQLINAVDTFVFYDDVNFINRGWINRNNILFNKAAFLFTIPLVKASQNRLINEIEIAAQTAWKDKLLRTLDAAYKKAPMYETVFPMLQKWFDKAEGNIAAYNFYVTRDVCDYIGIETNLVPSSSVYDNTRLKAQERILDICLQEETKRYINPIGGMDIYEPSLFHEKTVALKFIKARLNSYPQFQNEFVPGLSILDYMMFLPAEEIKSRLNDFDLIAKDEHVGA